MDIQIGLINQEQLSSLPMKFIILPSRIVLLNGNGVVLLERVVNMAVLIMNVHYDLGIFVFFIVVYLVLHLIKVRCWSLGDAGEHSCVNEVGRVSEVASLLPCCLNPIIFTTRRTIKLNQWSAVLTIETRMGSGAERIVFRNYGIQIIAKGSESNLEVFPLFFKEYHCPEK